jgi:hypothetical protein
MDEDELALARRVVNQIHARGYKWDAMGAMFGKTGAHMSNIGKGRTKCSRDLYELLLRKARELNLAFELPKTVAAVPLPAEEAAPPPAPDHPSRDWMPPAIDDDERRYSVDIRAALGLSADDFNRMGSQLEGHYLYFVVVAPDTVSVTWIHLQSSVRSLPKFSSWRPKRVVTGFYYTARTAEVTHLYLIGHAAGTAEARLAILQPSPNNPGRDWRGIWSGRSSHGPLAAATCYLKSMPADTRRDNVGLLRQFKLEEFRREFQAEAEVLFSGEASSIAIAPD